MKKKFTAGMLALALVFSFPLGLAGCSASVEAENLMEGVQAKAAETPAQTDGREKVAITDFAVKTLQGSVCGGENILLSPVSLLSALVPGLDSAGRGNARRPCPVCRENLGVEKPSYHNNRYSRTYDTSDCHRHDILRLADAVQYADCDKSAIGRRETGA